MPYTNLDAVLGEGNRTAIYQAINSIESNLLFLINLTPEERATKGLSLCHDVPLSWAINEGRGAARECDRFLMRVTNLP